MAEKTIELPCDVGDTVYMITNYVSGRKLLDRAIIEGQVDRFIIGDAGIPMADICTCDGRWYIACSPSEYYVDKCEAKAALERGAKYEA